MFPFKVKKFSVELTPNEEKLEWRLSRGVTKSKFFLMKMQGQWYGDIKDNKGIIELGQGGSRNAFEPVVVFKWSTTGEIATVTGYYRIERVIICLYFMPILYGVYLSATILNVMPVLIITLFWLCTFLPFGLWSFNKNLKRTEEKFLQLIKRSIS